MLTVMLDSTVKVVVPFLVYVPCSPVLADFLSADKLKQQQHEKHRTLTSLLTLRIFRQWFRYD